MIDGGTALAAGVQRVFGAHAVVQPCVLHKRRDVGDDLALELARRIDRQHAGAFNDPDRPLARTSPRDWPPSSSAST